MTNELIGVVLAIVLTILLFVLRRLALPSERAKNRRHIAPKTSRAISELKAKTDDDAERVLWAPDFETEDQGRAHSY